MNTRLGIPEPWGMKVLLRSGPYRAISEDRIPKYGNSILETKGIISSLRLCQKLWATRYSAVTASPGAVLNQCPGQKEGKDKSSFHTTPIHFLLSPPSPKTTKHANNINSSPSKTDILKREREVMRCTCSTCKTHFFSRIRTTASLFKKQKEQFTL